MEWIIPVFVRTRRAPYHASSFAIYITSGQKDKGDSSSTASIEAVLNEYEEDGDSEGSVSEGFSIWANPIPIEILTRALARHACSDGLTMLAEHLRDAKPDLWNAYDQRRAEAELRYTLAFPLVLLTGALVHLGGWWFLTGLAAPAALFAWAQRLEKQSLQRIGIALNAGFIKDPLSEYLEEFHTAERPTDTQIVAKGVRELAVASSIRWHLLGLRMRLVDFFRRKAGDRYY